MVFVWVLGFKLVNRALSAAEPSSPHCLPLSVLFFSAPSSETQMSGLSALRAFETNLLLFQVLNPKKGIWFLQLRPPWCIVMGLTWFKILWCLELIVSRQNLETPGCWATGHACRRVVFIMLIAMGRPMFSSGLNHFLSRDPQLYKMEKTAYIYSPFTAPSLWVWYN